MTLGRSMCCASGCPTVAANTVSFSRVTPGRLGGALWQSLAGVVGMETTKSEPCVVSESLALLQAWASALIDGAYSWSSSQPGSLLWPPAFAAMFTRLSIMMHGIPRASRTQKLRTENPVVNCDGGNVR